MPPKNQDQRGKNPQESSVDSPTGEFRASAVVSTGRKKQLRALVRSKMAEARADFEATAKERAAADEKAFQERFEAAKRRFASNTDGEADGGADHDDLLGEESLLPASSSTLWLMRSMIWTVLIRPIPS